MWLQFTTWYFLELFEFFSKSAEMFPTVWLFSHGAGQVTPMKDSDALFHKWGSVQTFDGKSICVSFICFLQFVKQFTKILIDTL